MGQNVNSRNDYEEIDLLEIIRLLWQKVWLLAIGFVVGAAVMFAGSKFLMTPQYTAESIVYIFSNGSVFNLQDLQLGNQLTEDFTIIAKTREVIESVIDELQLDTDYAKMSERITVTNPNSSHMLRISVKWESPEVAADICNTLSDELREQIADIMNTDRPSVVQRAVVPTKKSSPNTTRNTAIGALVGALLIAAVLIIRYLTDDTIKTEEDVTKYLQLNTVAAFPYVRGFDDDAKTKTKKRA